MEERFRPLTFHGLILRSQLVNLLVRGVCYAENQSVRHARTHGPVLAERLLDTRVSMFAFICSRAPLSPGCRTAR